MPLRKTSPDARENSHSQRFKPDRQNLKLKTHNLLRPCPHLKLQTSTARRRLATGPCTLDFGLPSPHAARPAKHAGVQASACPLFLNPKSAPSPTPRAPTSLHPDAVIPRTGHRSVRVSVRSRAGLAGEVGGEGQEGTGSEAEAAHWQLDFQLEFAARKTMKTSVVSIVRTCQGGGQGWRLCSKAKMSAWCAAAACASGDRSVRWDKART